MKLERWLQLMRSFGFQANYETFQALCAAYSEKHRHYHNGDHVNECLRQLDSCAAQAENPNEIELAIWFHDAIYKPLSSDNERMSSKWAAEFLTANATSLDVVARVQKLILATEHKVTALTKDESLLVDIDLSILGADKEAYVSFEDSIRKEYQIIPMFIYRKKRGEVLNGFLQRPRIYLNQPFQSEREHLARSNLTWAILEINK